jgi:hypothetical protein
MTAGPPDRRPCTDVVSDHGRRGSRPSRRPGPCDRAWVAAFPSASLLGPRPGQRPAGRPPRRSGPCTALLVTAAGGATENGGPSPAAMVGLRLSHPHHFLTPASRRATGSLLGRPPHHDAELLGVLVPTARQRTAGYHPADGMTARAQRPAARALGRHGSRCCVVGQSVDSHSCLPLGYVRALARMLWTML